MQSLRRAALCLHALSKTDREWLLNSLPDKHRGELRSMLKELKSMGIPADSRLIPLDDTAGDINTQAPAIPELVDDCDIMALIDRADARRIAQILDGESVAVVATIMATRDWYWAGAYFKLLPPDRRKTLEAAMHSANNHTPEKVRRTLLKLLANSLDAPISENRFGNGGYI